MYLLLSRYTYFPYMWLAVLTQNTVNYETFDLCSRPVNGLCKQCIFSVDANEWQLERSYYLVRQGSTRSKQYGQRK